MTDTKLDIDVVNGAVWDEFCDSLKGLKQYIVNDDTPADGLNRAEGFRYLTRLLRNGLENQMEDTSPRFPVLRKLGNMVKMGADNPDNIYMTATINGDHDYRITGTRGTVHYLGISAISGSYGADSTMITDAFLDSDALHVDPNGCFEIVLSQQKQQSNWLALTPRTRSVMIRQTFLDRRAETPAELTIERVGATDTPEVYSATRLKESLQAVSAYLHGTTKLFADWSSSFIPISNTLPPADQTYCQSIGADPNIFYFHSHWAVADDEILEIRAPTIPQCTSWNFQLDNYWMESLDYRYYNITVNKHSAKTEPDGSVILCISHRDPGYGNWIDTAGHSLGTMCWRWISAESHPLLKTRLVKVKDAEP